MSTTRPTSTRGWTADLARDANVALTLEGVSRAYGRTVALSAFTLRLEPGTICRVVGPNGSGKTTLLRLAAGVLAPSTGERRADGLAIYLRSGDGAREGQTTRQAVSFAARGDRDVGHAASAILSAEITEAADVPVRRLSAGQRARMTLAVGLACRPAIACLDEPTVHLDAQGRAVANRVIRELASGGCAVLVATHDPGFLSDVADARVCLRDGVLEAASW